MGLTDEGWTQTETRTEQTDRQATETLSAGYGNLRLNTLPSKDSWVLSTELIVEIGHR